MLSLISFAPIEMTLDDRQRVGGPVNQGGILQVR